MDSVEEEKNGFDIVIVGGGIGGLATALALHRKGFKDVAVFEKSRSLRGEGSAIGIFPNGWRALDQLGVASQLRDKAILVQGVSEIRVDRGGSRKHMIYPAGEARCLKRSDLINALADALPPRTIRFECKVSAVKMDPESMSPTLQLHDGKAVQAKVLIGCDGSNSKVADFIGLKPPTLFTLSSVRGLTTYPNGHLFPPEFVRMKRDKGDRISIGRTPINNTLVYWFVAVPSSWLEGSFVDDPQLIKQSTLSFINGYPADAVEMIEKSDLDSLSMTHLRYRSTWEILFKKFSRGSVTVAGDAMHVMGPFLGQGGSAALEDAVVLARNLANISSPGQSDGGKQILTHKIGEALDQYVKERRMRIVRLSTQVYLTGVIIGSTSSAIKFMAIIMLVILFRDVTGHTKYDCGKL